ncbi:tetratricopeptide repeat protein [Bergeyella zoohelcum]|uniref:Uncharacterized protein n=2 Tax=Bergeyella zoohelcum TaxID=1015 RepID=K1LQV4_9FLAO|nr:tetratricopeptide repeat protein [Bergeyella zoohelcum]EKB59325.1 hypothetical protein HMPREF9699_00261 [Bergeyella zoohelcum ATCC 43767]SUV49564.1 Tetratricopeptide repeat [Bergeyella zoohelcum]
MQEKKSLQSIKELFNSRNYTDIIEQQEQINMRSNSEELYLLGKSYFKIKNFKEAILCFEKIGNKKSNYWLGVCKFWNDDSDSALIIFTSIEKEYNDNNIIIGDNISINDIYYGIARCYLNNKEFKKSIEYFNKIKDNNHDIQKKFLLKNEQSYGEYYNPNYGIGRCYYELAILEEKKKFTDDKSSIKENYNSLAKKHFEESIIDVYFIFMYSEFIYNQNSVFNLNLDSEKQHYYETCLKDEVYDFIKYRSDRFFRKKRGSNFKKPNFENDFYTKFHHEKTLLLLEDTIYSYYYLAKCNIRSSNSIIAFECVNEILEIINSNIFNNLTQTKHFQIFSPLVKDLFENISINKSLLGLIISKYDTPLNLDKHKKYINIFEKKFNSFFDQYYKQKSNEIISFLQNKSIDIKNLESSDNWNYCINILSYLKIDYLDILNIPLAHYTSSKVCSILFDLEKENYHTNSKDKKEILSNNNLRMWTSNYMNDPMEGKNLLEVIGHQDLELDNIIPFSEKNAFFTSLTTRINDLNQFRLYGKEDGVESSGCCLVFNNLGNKNNYFNLKTQSFEIENKLNDPLYQVAYIVYYDQYTEENELMIPLDDKERKFGVYLKPLRGNITSLWHQKKLEKLSNNLNKLKNECKDKSIDNIKDIIEYIRYLFKNFAFKDEDEIRVITLEKYDSNRVKNCEYTGKLYVPIDNLLKYIDTIILGSNFEKTSNKKNMETFYYKLKKKKDNINIIKSSLPYVSTTS